MTPPHAATAAEDKQPQSNGTDRTAMQMQSAAPEDALKGACQDLFSSATRMRCDVSLCFSYDCRL
eukprot:m.33335 g.33335  ORF g.33335 m.33335 type:complete len:65 (+) comp5608_c0_seq2:132-326(+)